MNSKPDLSLILYLSSIKLNLSHIELLKYFKEGTQDFLPGKHKLLTELAHQGHIFEGEITERGRSLIKEIETWDGIYEPKSKPKKVKVEYSEEFLEWWNLYPTSDNFVFAGKEFSGTRSLRAKKDECSVKYQNLLKEYKHEDLIKALKFEVLARMDQSVIRGKNEMSYLSATPAYLEQRKFEAFLGRGEYKVKSVEEKKPEMIKTENLF